MKWTKLQTADGVWGREITNLAEKERAAAIMAKKLKKGDVIGVGSGSTSFVTLKALVSRRESEGLDFIAIVTSIEMELVCAALSVPTTSLKVMRPDWSFDGADEVDGKGNMIKGRGGALLREKLVIVASKKPYIVIDQSKLVKRLGQNFPVPVEIYPDAIQIVLKALKVFDTITDVELRQAEGKDGPIITENGNLILDVKFSKISNGMEQKLKSIVGVVDTGLFMGYKTTVVMS
ncbi:MAG TPA: ribose 5-phosphate isomerase A [Patescibacteria group bacterium]|nr:ribose 5-phosphate isomerase A [Patescibacteria group bacterium]